MSIPAAVPAPPPAFSRQFIKRCYQEGVDPDAAGVLLYVRAAADGICGNPACAAGFGRGLAKSASVSPLAALALRIMHDPQ